MSDDFDATAAAARAVGKQSEGTLTADAGADGGTENHAAAEGADSSGSDGLGSTSAWREMLLSTGPDDPLEQVESPWDPERGGLTRMYRGIRKMTGLDGMPAIADLVVGAVEVAHDLTDALADDDPDGDVEDADVQEDGDDAEDSGAIEGVPSA